MRDPCHITGKSRIAAHWSCNINVQITKNVPVIFNNLKGCDSHLIFYEIKIVDVKINVIPNGLKNTWHLF